MFTAVLKILEYEEIKLTSLHCILWLLHTKIDVSYVKIDFIVVNESVQITFYCC